MCIQSSPQLSVYMNLQSNLSCSVFLFSVILFSLEAKQDRKNGIIEVNRALQSCLGNMLPYFMNAMHYNSQVALRQGAYVEIL